MIFDETNHCKICKKDLSEPLKALSEGEVDRLHTSAHHNEEVINLFEQLRQLKNLQVDNIIRNYENKVSKMLKIINTK